MAILYERYLPSVWRYAYSRLAGDDAAARDVVSETFLAMLQGLARPGRAPDDVARWLNGVARHKLADHWRRSGPQAAANDPDPPDRQADPAAGLDDSETRRAVGETMAGMEDLHRLALEWKYIDGLTVREIAERLGCTGKSVEAILYRARAAFKARYERTER